MKPSKAQQLQQIYARPLPNGTGLEPKWKGAKPYAGLKLPDFIQRRIDEYRAYPSLQERTRWIVGGV